MGISELIALIIGTGMHGVDVLDLAAAVRTQLISGNRSVHALAEIPGIGIRKAAAIVAALQLPDRLRQLEQGTKLTSPELLYQACSDFLDQPQEQVVVFYLSTRHSVLRREIVSIGTASASLVHPRDVFRSAICCNASHIALAHNHPSGSLEPSQADLQLTQQLAQAGHQLGIQLIDHLICTQAGFTSLKIDYPQIF